MEAGDLLHASQADWELSLARLEVDRSRIMGAMAVVAQSYPMYAKQYRLYYDALIAEQFTPEQALVIIRAHGWLPR